MNDEGTLRRTTFRIRVTNRTHGFRQTVCVKHAACRSSDDDHRLDFAQTPAEPQGDDTGTLLARSTSSRASSKRPQP